MKKLMVLATVALCAVMAQAAQFEWSATNVRNGWENGETKISGTAYLFLVGANGASVDAVTTAISGATDVSALGTTLAGMSIDSYVFESGAIAGMTGAIDATAPASLFFAVISDDGYAYKSAAVSVESIEALGATTVAFGSQKNASNVSSAWTAITTSDPVTPAVPEPTSGLLMLVGLGALALRRRRA